MARTKLDTKIRRDQIAEAALALFAENGLREVSVAAVARRVGITPSALYRHYPGKDEILDAVLERMRDRMLALVAGVAEGPGGALDALRRLHGLHAEMVRENQALFPLLLIDAFQSGSPQRRRRVFEVITAYLDRIGALARRGQREGSIRRDVSARTVALMFFGAVQPPAMLAVLSGGEFDPRRHVREAWTFLEQTLRGTAAPARRRAPRSTRRTGDN